jgi:hypothetical protein
MNKKTRRVWKKHRKAQERAKAKIRERKAAMKKA